MNDDNANQKTSFAGGSMETEDFSPVWIRGAVWALGIGLACSIGLLALSYSLLTDHYDGAIEAIGVRHEAIARQHEELRDYLSALDAEVARVIQHVEDHEDAAQYHISDIRRTVDAVAALERGFAAKQVKVANISGQLDALAVKLDSLFSSGGPAKRFTSDDGAKLEAIQFEQAREIKQLTERIHRLELKTHGN